MQIHMVCIYNIGTPVHHVYFQCDTLGMVYDSYDCVLLMTCKINFLGGGGD